MKLVASVPIHNEADRYLIPFVEHLLAFCDEVRILDDASSDGGPEMLMGLRDGADHLDLARVHVQRLAHPEFFVHEGRFRNRLIDWTLEAEPTHVLSIDADEFISEGDILRSRCEENDDVWILTMEEVWKADDDGLSIRMDGGWRPRPAPALWQAPPPSSRARDRDWQIANRALACGREPVGVARQAIRGRARDSGVQILHFGWTRLAERQRRFDRYALHDKGKFHANAHLQSILWSDDQVKLERREWPSLDRQGILRVVNREVL